MMLTRTSPVFAYDPSLWAILDDGSFLGVASDTELVFPALPIIGVSATANLDHALTDGRQPRVIDVTEHAGGWRQV